ncbi:MAG: aminotransferase family protein [Bacteroidales bacterium]
MGAVFYRNPTMTCPIIVRGKGIYIWDSNGNRYIDGCAGAMVTNIGHGNKQIIRTMISQAKKLSYVHNARVSNIPQENLAEKLIRLSPKGFVKVAFCGSGSEANEMALRIARLYHLQAGAKSKWKIISGKLSYHGSTMGALSITGLERVRVPYEPYLWNFPLINVPYCYRCPIEKQYPGCFCRCANQLEDIIVQEGSENISAFITEPIIAGSAPAVSPPLEYFKIVRDICNKYNIILIADEIATAIGRTGKNFAFEHYNITPDLVTIGKGISGGYAPIGGVLIHKRVYEVLKKLNEDTLAHTYSGHPLSCAVTLEVLNYVEKYELAKKCSKLGEYFLRKLKILAKFHIVGDIRGKGLLLGVEYVADKKSKKPFPSETKVHKIIYQSALKRGLIIMPSCGSYNGRLGDNSLIAPPFIITESQIDNVVNILEETIGTVQNQVLKE